MSLLKQINESANHLDEEKVLLEFLTGYDTFILKDDKLIVESTGILLDRIEQSLSKHPSEQIKAAISKVLAHLEAIRTGVSKLPNVKDLLDTAAERGANKLAVDMEKGVTDPKVKSKIDDFSAKIKQKIDANDLQDITNLINKIRKFATSGQEAFGTGKTHAPD